MKTSSRRAAKSPKPPPSVQVVVLAAGAGARLRSTLPKVLHRVAGRTLLETILDTAESLSPSETVVVWGPSRGVIETALSGRQVAVAVQNAPRGTGDAARCAIACLSAQRGSVLVLPGDVPLVRGETLRRLIQLRESERLDLAVLSFRPPDPGDLRRVQRGPSGRVRRIAEATGAARKSRGSSEVSAGVYCFDSGALASALTRLGQNRVSGEIDLEDVAEIMVRRGGRVDALEVEDWREAWGIDTRRQLAAAEEIAHRQGIERALDAGATLIDPSTTRIGPSVVVEPDAVIHPFVLLEGKTTLSAGCEVLPFTRVSDSRIAALAVVGPHSDVEGAVVGPRARAGPYARLRPGTVLEEDVRVGNFVETKEATLKRGVKAMHHAYLGDAEIGAEANIGAGVITCNYDGRNKNRTVVGAGAFVGSDTQLVAPVTVGEGAYIGAGSTITEDVPPGALSLSRVPQKNKEGWVARRRAARAGKTGPEGSGSR